jgi:C-terminal processing protease CtpA/Prc
VEHAVALVDMHGFVIRDTAWELPIDSQVLGYLKLSDDKQSGEYTLYLPQRPQGIANDVDNNSREDHGVQIFAVSYWPNLAGGPFAEGDDPSKGWPTYLASIRTDTENKDEVIGGKLVVWSPDANQQFPTGFGSDGLLFTADDPVGPIPAGYALVNLDDDPFSVSQAPEEALVLYEPQDIAEKDFSGLSYVEAFDQMFAIVRKEYAFNGIAGKQPDWDQLYAKIKPQVEKAQNDKDGLAFYQAIRDFTWAFKDGHVGMSSDIYTNADLYNYAGGGFGFTLRELDNGKVLVTYVLAGGPAEQAGLKIGAEITEFNGKPIKDAISAVQPYFPQSSDFAIRLEQQRFLIRVPSGTAADVTFINPGGNAETVTLTASGETETYARADINYTDEPPSTLPVDSKVIAQAGGEIGFIRINSNYDDLNLIIRLFERALKEFEERNVAGIIIDMRSNTGGAPLGLAGFLTGQEIILGQTAYYSDKTDQFEPDGEPDKVTPYEQQYHFTNMATLVGPNCYSACEIESYGFSQVPGMIVVGQYPTAGVEAEVARGQFKLPEGIGLQIPTGRITFPDGTLFLEGAGVQPTLRVPVDETTVLSNEDIVLRYALDTVLKPAGQGLKPSGPPAFIGDKDKVRQAAQNGAQSLEALARENYSSEELTQMNRSFSYTISLDSSKELLWSWTWCASSQQILTDNFEHIQLSFTLDGRALSPADFGEFTYEDQGLTCRAYFGMLTDWPGGEHKLQTNVIFNSSINDGQADYPAGTQIFQYLVYVKP